MKLQAEWRDRLRHWIHTLAQDFYQPIGEIRFDAFFTYEQLPREEAEKQSFMPIEVGTKWGQQWQYAWLKSKITLPDEAKNKMIVMDLRPGGEATLFVNGKSFGTKRAEWVNVPHHYIQDNILCESGEAGKNFELLVEAYAGHYFPESELGGCAVGPVLPGKYQDPLEGKERTELGKSTYGIWNEDAYQLWMDVVTLKEVMENLSEGSLRAAKIAKGLKDFTLCVDFEQPLDARIKDYRKGREILKPLLQAKNGSTAPTFYGIGNSHLDVVWLWPYQETIRKTSRTFAQQLRLIEKYPEYKYIQSQPQTYQMCKDHYPELYERIQQAAKKGGWIAEGAMWVEPDTNMTSGESLVRQLLYGMKFFKEEFGVDCEILWLPDTFGYSAALPQILKGFGVKYLVTQKIFWSYNEGEQFPYHYFTWQGNDGSEIVSYLPTSYTYRTNPAELMQVWENRVQKDEMDKFLLPYGYGDGGGGPTRDFIEFGERQKDLEGAPKFKMTSPNQLFYDLEAEGGPVHKYTGELYFTAHRGVYTSQASIKWGNRKSELALREAELWAALAFAQKGLSYPMDEFEAQWKKVLLNQFHDILPGSSIARVYQEAAVLHQEVIDKGTEIAQNSAAYLAGENGNVSVFNSLSFARTVLVELPDTFKSGARTAEGEMIPLDVADGKIIAKVFVPACGFTVLEPCEQKAEVERAVSVAQNGEEFVLENHLVRAVLNANGEIVSFVRKDSGREFAAAPMNQFLLYKDVPRLFDAWDIDSPYEEQLVEVNPKAEIRVVSESPLQVSVEVKKTIGVSALRQTISLSADSTRIEFDTTVDWKELHRLLKVSFPVDVYATEGYNEIQYGYMKRPTHRSRQYDKDRFEVCNHRYTALCDETHGAAVLNDCKYGVSMLDNAINLTLLKAAGSPELRADNREHHFTYAFTAWDGPFAFSDVVQQGYELNVPALVVNGGEKSKSFVTVSNTNIILDTVKLAEDGSGDMIMRLYESKGGDSTTEIHFAVPVVSVSSCNMNETKQEQGELDCTNQCASLRFHPFEVHTIRVKTK